MYKSTFELSNDEKRESFVDFWKQNKKTGFKPGSGLRLCDMKKCEKVFRTFLKSEKVLKMNRNSKTYEEVYDIGSVKSKKL